MSVSWKPLKQQVQEINNFFQYRSILILTSLILSYFLGKIQFSPKNVYGEMSIGVSYWIVLTLFAIVLYQMFQELNDDSKEAKGMTWKSFVYTFKRMNYIMLILMTLLALLLMSFALEYFIAMPETIGATIGLVIAPFLLLGLQIIVIGIPIIIGRFILTKADKEKNLKDKCAWYLLSWLLMGVAIPAIAFLWRRQATDMLIMPVFFSWLMGWIILFDFGLQSFKKWKKSRVGRKKGKGK